MAKKQPPKPKPKEYKKSDVKSCAGCRFAEPSFNLLYCSYKGISKGYSEVCDDWLEKRKPYKEDPNEWF